MARYKGFDLMLVPGTGTTIRVVGKGVSKDFPSDQQAKEWVDAYKKDPGTVQNELPDGMKKKVYKGYNLFIGASGNVQVFSGSSWVLDADSEQEAKRKLDKGKRYNSFQNGVQRAEQEIQNKMENSSGIMPNLGKPLAGSGIDNNYRFQLVEFPNGKFGVKDTKSNFIVSAGMSKEQAEKEIDTRMNRMLGIK